MADQPIQTATRPELMLEPEPDNLPAPYQRDEAPQRPRVVTEPRGLQLQADRAVTRQSAELGELYGALAEAQSADGYGDIEKSRTAKVQSSKANYSYDYETLADVIAATRPFLGKQGIAVMQFGRVGASTMTVTTRLGHRSGQWIESDLTASISSYAPQDVGAGMSFLRRYGWKGATGVAAYDEDNDAAPQQRPAPQPSQRKSEQRQAPPPVSALHTKPIEETRPAPPEPPAQPSPQQQAPDNATLGKVGVVAETGCRDGVWRARLGTGYVFGTRDARIGAQLDAYAKRGIAVEVIAEGKPGFLPMVVEIIERATTRA